MTDEERIVELKRELAELRARAKATRPPRRRYSRRRRACRHKTAEDFSTLYPPGPASAEARVTIWTCSVCGARGRWTDSWQWYGLIECLSCGLEAIDHVVCSDDCRTRKAA